MEVTCDFWKSHFEGFCSFPQLKIRCFIEDLQLLTNRKRLALNLMVFHPLVCCWLERRPHILCCVYMVFSLRSRKLIGCTKFTGLLIVGISRIVSQTTFTFCFLLFSPVFWTKNHFVCRHLFQRFKVVISCFTLHHISFSAHSINELTTVTLSRASCDFFSTYCGRVKQSKRQKELEKECRVTFILECPYWWHDFIHMGAPWWKWTQPRKKTSFTTRGSVIDFRVGAWVWYLFGSCPEEVAHTKNSCRSWNIMCSKLLAHGTGDDEGRKVV